MENKPLYHWSPSKNRKSIAKNGLKPCSIMGRVCLSESPSFALGMCPHLKGRVDLWMTWASDCGKLVRRRDTRGKYAAEWRTKDAIKRVWFVGSRAK